MRVRRWNSSLFVNVPDKPKARTAIRKVSPRQSKRTRNLAVMKKQWIAEQFRLQGFCKCQGPCGREIHDERDARLILDGHHTRKRSLGGKDVPEQLLYMCRGCHDKVPPTKRGDGI